MVGAVATGEPGRWTDYAHWIPRPPAARSAADEEAERQADEYLDGVMAAQLDLMED